MKLPTTTRSQLENKLFDQITRWSPFGLYTCVTLGITVILTRPPSQYFSKCQYHCLHIADMLYNVRNMHFIISALVCCSITQGVSCYQN